MVAGTITRLLEEYFGKKGRRLGGGVGGLQGDLKFANAYILPKGKEREEEKIEEK